MDDWEHEELAVIERPYTLLSCAVSLDGYLDDAAGSRLLLSNAADFERVDGLRAGCDAVLVGAGTVRKDNPALTIHDAMHRQARMTRGRTAEPIKVVVTVSGELPLEARFFTMGKGSRLVYCAHDGADALRERLGKAATVVDAGDEPTMTAVSVDLAARGVHRLMVEGGGNVVTQFLQAGLADELQLAVAPLFVGDQAAPRWVSDGHFPWDADNRATLAQVRHVGDIAVLRYALSGRFRR